MYLQSKNGNGIRGTRRVVAQQQDITRAARPLAEGWTWHLYGTHAELAGLRGTLVLKGQRIKVHRSTSRAG